MFDPFAYVGPLVRQLDPEAAHDLTLTALRSGWVEGLYRSGKPDPEALAITVAGLKFPNPVGLAAGFDKNAEVPDPLLRLGFGFVEVGTVTPEPQPGNPKPRIFRLTADDAIINRLGFNSDGLVALSGRLRSRSARPGLVGANLGANKDSDDRLADYLEGIQVLYGLASYFTINVSSPNTPGLRDLQSPEFLGDLLGPLVNERSLHLAQGADRAPIFLKVAPDLDDGALKDVVDVAFDYKIDGLIVGNTTIGGRETLRSALASETGGLSGQPLFDLATEKLRTAYKLSEGKLPLIGVGGVGSGAQAFAKIKAGASLVQLYTALVYHGPKLVTDIKADLLRALEAEGFGSVAEAVGASA
ncbi:MAG: quinone-dependent dihydroorotate dehydrogenase [Pseudomonadota bacterium]